MIKANELRIGNRILLAGIDYDQGGNKFNDPDGDEEIEVTIEILNQLNIYPFNYKPIPLTPEWLERMGFVKDGRNSFKKGTYSVVLGTGGGKNSFCLVNYGILSAFAYLHQLQNLYFALTGEELTIKETV